MSLILKKPLKLLILTLLAITPMLSYGTPRVQLGIDTLTEHNFTPLQGKRIGLLTNPAGVNSKGQSTLSILYHAPNVNLTALFGPEHGIYGNEKATTKVDDSIDRRTGLPVYSLHGTTRRPTKQVLDQIDIMVIDIQDVGTRSYTYISTVRYVLEECFRYGKEVIILDRPNPLGGYKVDGPIMDKKWLGFLGAYPIPYVYGLTIGELAIMAKNEKGWLPEITDYQRKKGKLTVIPMQGWKRSMQWPETGLKWVPTSPIIRDVSAVMGYPMTGLGCQIGGCLHGYGTKYAFRLLSHPKVNLSQLERDLKSKQISGVTFKPVIARGKNGKSTQGLYILITDYNIWRPTELSFYLMQLSAKWNGYNPFPAERQLHNDLFNKHVGSEEWWEAITKQGSNVNVERFLAKWDQEAKRFQNKSSQYWLYK